MFKEIYEKIIIDPYIYVCDQYGRGIYYDI